MKKKEIIKLTPSDIEYPEKLKRYKTFPKELYAIGNIELLNKYNFLYIIKKAIVKIIMPNKL